MRFKEGNETRLRGDWDERIHPDLRTLLLKFEAFSSEKGLPPPLLTELVRDPEEQIRIYVTFWKKLIEAMKPGPHHGEIDPENDGTFRPLERSEKITAEDLEKAIEIRVAAEETARKVTLGEAQRAELVDVYLRERAAKKFTWHFARTAADGRTRHYSKAQLVIVADFFKLECADKNRWEFLIHDVTAPHFHVARRDFSWRARFGTPT